MKRRIDLSTKNVVCGICKVPYFSTAACHHTLMECYIEIDEPERQEPVAAVKEWEHWAVTCKNSEWFESAAGELVFRLSEGWEVADQIHTGTSQWIAILRCPVAAQETPNADE